MASEDLFEEDFSEEIISELDHDYVGNVIESEVVKDVLEEVSEGGSTNQGDTTEKSAFETPPTDIAVLQLITNGNMLPTSTAASGTTEDHESKLFHLPLTRIRNIMKLDPDLHIVSNEAVFAVTRATELFIESVAREAYTYTAQAKKKTIQKRDVEMAVSAVDCLIFLDGAMNF